MSAHEQQHKERKHKDEEHRRNDNNRYGRPRPARPQTARHNGIRYRISNRWLPNFIRPTTPCAGVSGVTRLMHHNPATRTTLPILREHNLAPTNCACTASDFHAD